MERRSTRENFKKNVCYIGLKHKDVSFAISLTEHDRVQLLDDDSRKESGSETYYERECDALFDINGRGNTERLVVRNPKLRNLLKDGEYIPSWIDEDFNPRGIRIGLTAVSL